MTIRETQTFGLPEDMHHRRIDEKLLLFNGIRSADTTALRLAVVAVNCRKVAGEWQVAITDPAATAAAQGGAFGSFVEDDGSLSQREILATAEGWIRGSATTKRVPGRSYLNINPFAPNAALGYLLVEADPAPNGVRRLPAGLQGAGAVSCDTCVAACCRKGVTLLLTDREASQQRRTMSLRRAKASVNYGRDIRMPRASVDIAGNVTKPQTVVHLPKYVGVYTLREDCGNLGEAPDGGENRPCKIHGQEDLYPGTCRSFEVGSAECLARRAEYAKH